MIIVRFTKLMIELYKNRNEFAVILDCSQNAAIINSNDFSLMNTFINNAQKNITLKYKS